MKLTELEKQKIKKIGNKYNLKLILLHVIYKNLLLDPLNINKIIAGFFSTVNNYLPKSKGFK